MSKPIRGRLHQPLATPGAIPRPHCAPKGRAAKHSEPPPPIFLLDFNGHLGGGRDEKPNVSRHHCDNSFPAARKERSRKGFKPTQWGMYEFQGRRARLHSPISQSYLQLRHVESSLAQSL